MLECLCLKNCIFCSIWGPSIFAWNIAMFRCFSFETSRRYDVRNMDDVPFDVTSPSLRGHFLSRDYPNWHLNGEQLETIVDNRRWRVFFCILQSYYTWLDDFFGGFPWNWVGESSWIPKNPKVQNHPSRDHIFGTWCFQGPLVIMENVKFPTYGRGQLRGTFTVV